MTPSNIPKRVLLVGAGHAHLHIIGRARALRDAGVELRLISPPTFTYSGLATGVLSGALAASAGEIDVADLSRRYDVAHDPTTVAAVDLAAMTARLACGSTVAFDVISFNVGSQVADPHQIQGDAEVAAVKPLSSLVELKRRVEVTIAALGRAPAIVVGGGGQTAFEVAAALSGLCERLGVVPRITVVGSTVSAAWAPPTAAQRLLALLAPRGVKFWADRVTGQASGRCQLESGRQLPCDVLVLATGLVAPNLISGLGLATDTDGRLRVTPRLQALEHDRVFAVGDCAVIDAHPRPCAGVFGVRAAPILVNNLTALASGGPLVGYRPQRRWLSIMDLGDGRGLALRGKLWWMGAAALQLKRWLDLRFVRSMRSG